MSLRKSPASTPARIEASRRNARLSTGPRTPRGKAQSRLNGLRHGNRSVLRRRFLLHMLKAEPCDVERAAGELLTPEQAAHPFFAEALQLFRRVEGEVATQFLPPGVRLGTKAEKCRVDPGGERSLNTTENKEAGVRASHDVNEKKPLMPFRPLGY